MQFNLRNLLSLVALLSLYLALAVAVPPLLAGMFLLAVSQLLCVAIVIGIIYAKGKVRAFWIGSSLGGLWLLLSLFALFVQAILDGEITVPQQSTIYLLIGGQSVVALSGLFAMACHSSLTKPAVEPVSDELATPSRMTEASSVTS